MNHELQFPKGATKQEKDLLWTLIGSTSDVDLGFSFDKDKKDKAKYAVRIILLNQIGELGFIKSERYSYHQIPGGGIEQGESIIRALRRETIEEMGYTIKDVQPMGYYFEERKSHLNNHSWTKAFTFVFLANISENVGTRYMPDEIEEGFCPVWLDLDEAISIKEKRLKEVLANQDSYSAAFSERRDLTLLNYYKQKILSIKQ